MREGTWAVPTQQTKLMTFPVLPGSEQVHPLENESGYLWVKGPLVVRGEGSSKVIRQYVPGPQEM